MKIGFIGLGKMGFNMVLNLKDHKVQVVAYNRSHEPTHEIKKKGVEVAFSTEELMKKLPNQKIIWIMVTAGKPVDAVIEEILRYLKLGDIVIDGGNSFYEDSVKRYNYLKKKGIHFLDIGTSGGLSGARNGACMMIGGDKKIFSKIEPIVKLVTVKDGYSYCGEAGSGHFVKMIHNGIEYGMMQSIAEGFAVLKNAPFKLDLKNIVKVYNNGSIIESRLIGWLKDAFEKDGIELKNMSGTVGHTGEGEWTIKTAEKLNVPVPIIKGSFDFRIQSEDNPSYAGKVLSALRFQFGGHETDKKK